VSAGTLIPLDGLVGQFPTDADGFFLAYAESVSAVDFMFRTYGTDALVTLVRSYKDGRTDDEAFEQGLGVDTTAFATGWLNSLGTTAPPRYGPQPAPTGPIPSAWLAGGAVGSPAAGAIAGASPGSTTHTAAPAPATASGDATMVVGAALAFVIIIGLVALGAARRGRRRAAGGPEA
jgi:hypothetical protein